MFGVLDRPYAARMERNASVIQRVILAAPALNRRSAKTLTVRCLKAVAVNYVESCAYNPYWIGAGPLTNPRQNEDRRG